jgi:2-oxoacid:acceptor oxidoreductase delta subunit (pyruvate/2-ketoisovalerate family)
MKLTEDYIAPIGRDLYVINTGDWRYQRPVTDPRKCGKCGLCWVFCPTQCIEVHATHFQADMEFCKGCGICAHECPNGAIRMIEESRE